MTGKSGSQVQDTDYGLWITHNQEIQGQGAKAMFHEMYHAEE